VIEAAGGAVCRHREDGELEVLVVHRPRYDDWSLPKGKLDPGESAEDAARREVEEETGFRCELGVPLPSVRYLDHRGRPKRVQYWTMRPVEGAFTPNAEVDDLRWLTHEEALALLSYEHDRVVVEALRERSA
jgi:8-oxo-dGTP diphosphatase